MANSDLKLAIDIDVSAVREAEAAINDLARAADRAETAINRLKSNGYVFSSGGGVGGGADPRARRG